MKKNFFDTISEFVSSKNDIIKTYDFFTEKFGKDRARAFKAVIDKNPRFDIDKFIESFKYRIESNKNNTELLYDPKYISLRYNLSLNEAKQYIKEYKKNKATSKENFIKKHGEIEGIQKFKKFQETSAKANQNIKSRLKKENKSQKKYYRENSRRCYEFYLKRKLTSSVESAKKMAIQHQLENAGVHKKFYEKREYSLSEINDIFEIINTAKAKNSRNRKFLKEKYGEEWISIYEKSSAKYRKKMEEKGLWIKEALIDDYSKYHRLCWFYTRQTLFFSEIQDIEKRCDKFHLDHIFSIKDGFINDIPAEIIGSTVNLRIISREQNCSKGSKSDISKKELYKRYENYKNN